MKVLGNGTINSSYQRVILDVLNGSSNSWTFSFDQQSVTRGDNFGGDVFVKFLGRNLQRDSVTGAVTGKVTGIEIYDSSFSAPLTSITGVRFRLENLIAAAGAVTNEGSEFFPAYNYGDGTFSDFMSEMTRGVHKVIGSNGTDIMETTAAQDVLKGGKGNDRFIFNASTLLEPDATASSARQEASDDSIIGGAGRRDLLILENDDFDQFYSEYYSLEYVVDLGNSTFESTVTALETGRSYIEITTISGVEHIRGSGGDDSFTGDSKNNKFWGYKGDDSLSGKGGDDVLIGGPGKDTLNGGSGNDTLSGGPGADVFVFRTNVGDPTYAGQDVITDFDPSQDTLQFLDPIQATPTIYVEDGDTIIEHGNGTIRLEGVTLSPGEISIEFI